MGQMVLEFVDAAEQGDVEACFRLGVSYSTGKGVPYDLVAAHKWLNVAAINGSREAISWRAELAREMSGAEISEAQRQAREWLAARG